MEPSKSPASLEKVRRLFCGFRLTKPKIGRDGRAVAQRYRRLTDAQAVVAKLRRTLGISVGNAVDVAAIRQPPMRVNLRASDLDCAGPLVVRENQSRRDLTKVAQYEVLG